MTDEDKRAAWIEKQLATAPEPTDQQLARVARLLMPRED